MKPRILLKEGLAELGLPHDESTLGRFMLYLAELKRWGRAYSITSIKDDEEVVVKHFLDSALYCLALEEGDATLADVGSGGGFPGIPLKILRPDLKITLIEPTGKKALFLSNMIRKLRSGWLEGGIDVIESRVESVSALGVDVAVTRALFEAEEFYEKARHLVRPGGKLVMSKGPKAHDELAALSAPARMIEARLPHAGIERNIIVISN